MRYFGLIRHPDINGEVVAKFDLGNKSDVPDTIRDHDAFAVQDLPDRSDLDDHGINHSGLSDDEQELLNQFYPVQS